MALLLFQTRWGKVWEYIALHFCHFLSCAPVPVPVSSRAGLNIVERSRYSERRCVWCGVPVPLWTVLSFSQPAEAHSNLTHPSGAKDICQRNIYWGCNWHPQTSQRRETAPADSSMLFTAEQEERVAVMWCCCDACGPSVFLVMMTDDAFETSEYVFRMWMIIIRVVEIMNNKSRWKSHLPTCQFLSKRDDV